ncbi:MAG TPA: hypothetical protein DCZ49_00365 [Hyphomonadaceae bacterium]|nr:hypothetical protein [Hyphomonadaceae bacterium]
MKPGLRLWASIALLGLAAAGLGWWSLHLRAPQKQIAQSDDPIVAECRAQTDDAALQARCAGVSTLVRACLADQSSPAQCVCYAEIAQFGLSDAAFAAHVLSVGADPKADAAEADLSDADRIALGGFIFNWRTQCPAQ